MPTQTKASASTSSTPTSVGRSYKSINLSLAGTFINFPASLHASAREESTGFRLCVNEGGVAKPVSQFYTADNKQYFTIGQLGRAIEIGDKLVPLTVDELASTKVEGKRGVEITSFVPLSQVDPVFFIKSYTLAPNTDTKKKTNPGNPQAGLLYKLLLTLLISKQKVGMAKMFDRDREYNVIVRPTSDGKALMLHTIFTSDEVRPINVNLDNIVVSPELSEMFDKVMDQADQLFTDFDAKGVTSTTDSLVVALVAKKTAEANGTPVPPTSETSAPVNESDALLAALTASLFAANVKVVKDEPVVTATV
jgi:DNA end-binding protein Ku